MCMHVLYARGSMQGQNAGLEVGCQKAQVVMKAATYSIRITVNKVVKTLTTLLAVISMEYVAVFMTSSAFWQQKSACF